MTPKPTTKRGKPCWTIDARSAGCGRLFGDSKQAVLDKLRTKLAGVDKIEFTDQDRLAKKELGAKGNLLEAVRYFLAHRPTGKRVALSVAVDEVCAGKAKLNCSKPYLTHLRHVLTQFQTHVGAVNCCDISSRHIEGYLHSKVWAGASRVGMRNRLSAFFAVCKSKGYCGLNPVDGVELARSVPKEPAIFSVEHAQRLLDTVFVLDPAMLPYFAIGLFCGIRPEEIKRLDTDNIRIDPGEVVVDAKGAKTRRRRIVEMSDNCKAWLRAAPSVAPVWNRKRFRSIVELSKVPWSNDVMRHSFASYHLAMHESADKTALQLGHMGSTKMLFSNYRSMVSRDDAAAFWQLEPVVMLTIVKEKAVNE